MFPWSRLAFAFAKRFVEGSRWGFVGDGYEIAG